MNHIHMYIDIELTKSCKVNQIVICISILFWFHRCPIGLYTTMALMTLAHPTPGCALKGIQISASLKSPENTSQPRSDSSVPEPNTSSVLQWKFYSRACTSSRFLPSSTASFPNTTMNLIHMSDSFL